MARDFDNNNFAAFAGKFSARTTAWNRVNYCQIKSGVTVVAKNPL